MLSVALFGLGLVLGFIFLDKREAEDATIILSLFSIVPFAISWIVVFAWNLWLAPFKQLDEKIDRINEERSGAVANTKTLSIEKPDFDRWKRVSVLKVYQVAELCGGVSPGSKPPVGSNDISRAVWSELGAALRSGKLHGLNLEGIPLKGKYASASTGITRADLKRYFDGRDDYPEFLKD